MSKITKFANMKFGELTVIEKDSEFYFIGNEIAELLGYSNYRKAVMVHVAEEDVTDKQEDKDKEENQTIPRGIKVEDSLDISNICSISKKTKAPSSYTVSSIISLMEKYNIGTSATRAEIIKKLMSDNSSV